MLLKYFLLLLENTYWHNYNFNYNFQQKCLIEKSADFFIDPCEDFYAHACNNYYQQHQDSEYGEITGQMDYEMNKKLIDLLEHLNFYAICNEAVLQQTIKYYRSCRKEKQRNIRKYLYEIKPAQDLNWPILEEVERDKLTLDRSRFSKWTQNTQFDLLDLLGKFQSYGLNNVLIYQELIQNDDGSFKIVLEPAYFDDGTSLPEETILQVLLMGVGLKNDEKRLKHLTEIQTTDRELWNIVNNFSQTENFKEISYHDLKQTYSNLNWTKFLNYILPENFENNISIVLVNPEYFDFLNNNLWQKFEKNHICNYLMMKFLYYLAKDSTADFTQLECIKDLRNKMDLAVNYLYNIYFIKEKEIIYKNVINNMFDKIKETVKQYFQKNNLNLTSSQIEYLNDKLKNIKINIGNLPQHGRLHKIEKFYENISNLNENNYYRNHLIMLKHRFNKSLIPGQNQSFFIAPDNSFGSSSAPVYAPKLNMVILPYGSLQFPLFHLTYNTVYKWSLLGFLLAHEISHAFDTTGLNIDSNGFSLADNSHILNNANFTSALQCMRDQQNTTNIDERIADLFGIDIVYRIFEQLVDSKQMDLRKVFFLNLAQFFCGKKNVRFIDHDEDSKRLQQIVINSRSFSEIYNCKVGSKMNPEEKCRLY